MAVRSFVLPATAAAAVLVLFSGVSLQGANYRTRTDVVAMNVTVTDAVNRYVRGLCLDDFEVLEDGVRQEIQFFSGGESALDLAIVVDTSASVGPRLPTIKAAATGFIRTLRPIDRATLVGFSDHPRVVQEWTSTRTDLERGVQGLRAVGGTGLYTALYVTLKGFKEAEPAEAIRRKAIVVLSDGEDTASSLSFDDVLTVARDAGVSLYTVRLKQVGEGTPNYELLRRNESLTAEYVMRTLAAETGARPFSLRRIEELAGAYASIAEELAHQYVLGYEPRPDTTGATQRPYRRLQVVVPGIPTASARTRTGYFAPLGRPVVSPTSSSDPGLPLR